MFRNKAKDIEINIEIFSSKKNIISIILDILN